MLTCCSLSRMQVVVSARHAAFLAPYSQLLPRLLLNVYQAPRNQYSTPVHLSSDATPDNSIDTYSPSASSNNDLFHRMDATREIRRPRFSKKSTTPTTACTDEKYTPRRRNNKRVMTRVGNALHQLAAKSGDIHHGGLPAMHRVCA